MGEIYIFVVKQLNIFVFIEEFVTFLGFLSM